MQGSNQTNLRTSNYGLTEAHIRHTVVHQHLDVVHLDNLIPHIGQQTQRQVAVGNGRLVWTLLLGTSHVDMYPLMVQGCVSKQVDTILVNLQPV